MGCSKSQKIHHLLSVFNAPVEMGVKRWLLTPIILMKCSDPTGRRHFMHGEPGRTLDYRLMTHPKPERTHEISHFGIL